MNSDAGSQAALAIDLPGLEASQDFVYVFQNKVLWG